MTPQAFVAQQLAPPRQVLLFSGHMTDTPDRPEPRFPLHKAAAAGRRLDDSLEELQAGPEDLALSQAAAGGDLLFLEACQRRGLRCQVLLPYAEAEFLHRSVEPSQGGEQWRDRYFAVKAALRDPVLVMPEALGEAPPGVNPFERCNRWLLHTALAHGADRLRFLCIWDGADAVRPGGTAHMYEEVRQRTGRVTRIDPRQL